MSEGLTDRDIAPHFDEVIHAPVRFRICGLLANATSMRFSTLRDALEISDATCSKHLKVLADNGYIKQEKGPGERNGHALTWVRLTAAGRRAFSAHLAELRRIAEGVADPG